MDKEQEEVVEDTQLVDDFKFLEGNGFSQFKLNLIHHSKTTEITYDGCIRYWSKGHKSHDKTNTAFKNRVHHIAEGYRNHKGKLSELMTEALEKFPKEK